MIQRPQGRVAPRALYDINPDFRGIYLTYFMFEEVCYKNTSASKISSDHFSRFLHKLYLIFCSRYLCELNTLVHQRKPTQT